MYCSSDLQKVHLNAYFCLTFYESIHHEDPFLDVLDHPVNALKEAGPSDGAAGRDTPVSILGALVSVQFKRLFYFFHCQRTLHVLFIAQNLERGPG